MSGGTKIEWTDATWNVVLGCDRVSPGCDSCYAIRTARRMASNPNPKVSGPYVGLVEVRDGRLDWTGQVNTVPDRLDLPLRWTKPRRIFVNAQSDLFHNDIPDAFIARVFGAMAATPRHTYQVLTKRHGRMRSLLSSPGFPAMVRDYAARFLAGHERPGIDRGKPWDLWPLPNVWLGVSVEDQQRANLRIPALLDTPAAVRFLSCEPLLGPVNIIGQGGNLVGAGIYALPDPPDHEGGEPLCQDHGAEMSLGCCRFIDWVIVGGESGPDARPMRPEWARDLRDQCQAAGVPYFFKQAGIVLARQWGCATTKGTDPAEWPEPFPQESPNAA